MKKHPNFNKIQNFKIVKKTANFDENQKITAKFKKTFKNSLQKKNSENTKF